MICTGCFQKNLTQSTYKPIFQSVPQFSHVYVKQRNPLTTPLSSQGTVALTPQTWKKLYIKKDLLTELSALCGGESYMVCIKYTKISFPQKIITHKHTHAQAYTCLYAHTNVYIHTCAHARLHTHMHTHDHLCYLPQRVLQYSHSHYHTPLMHYHHQEYL